MHAAARHPEGLPRPGELKSSKKFEQWAKQVARKPAPADPLALHRCGACSFPPRSPRTDEAVSRRSSGGAAASGGSDPNQVRAWPRSFLCGCYCLSSVPDLGVRAQQALVAAIRGRAQQGSSFLDALAAKHGGAAGKRSSKRGEPTDEEFAAVQARAKRKN